MRRPAPIPSSAKQRDEPIASTADWQKESRSRPQMAEAVSPDDSETVPIAPMFGTWGLAGASAESAGRGASDTSDESRTVSADEKKSASDAEEASSFGSRDVWRAARARRKTLRAEIRRFTQRSRRRRMVWIAGTAAVLLVILGSVVAAYSPLFSVEKITVLGAHSLDPAAVAQALEPQRGVPLALVDASAVKAALLAFPLIETYTLEARPPHDLTVRIVERTPVGVIESDAGFTVVDAAGVALSTTPERPPGYALIEIDGGAAAAGFPAAGRVMRTLPEGIRAQVDRVEAGSANDVNLWLQSGARIVWGSADQSVYKGVVLERVMASAPEADMYDVSSPEAVVLG